MLNNKNYFSNIQKHPFHLVTSSPWPILSSFGALIITTGLVIFIHFYSYGKFILFFGLFFTTLNAIFWWRDVIREGTIEGSHTKNVIHGLLWGFVLFVLSEIILFVSFFWTFLHSSVSASIVFGCQWPPVYFPVDYDIWPILRNSWILLVSGYTATQAHEFIVSFNYKSVYISVILYIFFTIVLGIIFIFFQFLEYCNSPLNINTDILGSIFYITTGFHGFHVIIGVCFLIVCLFRFYIKNFTSNHHIGFLTAVWYWHFVDVVWFAVLFIIYIAGLNGIM